MGTKKQELMDAVEENSMQSVKLYNLAHAFIVNLPLEEPNIYFEIGQKNPDGTTRCVYSSKSIRRTMNEYAASSYTEEDGFSIDVWENGEAVADIDNGKEPPPEPHITKGEFKVEMIKDKQKVMFEINKMEAGSTVASAESPCVHYQLQTVFRSNDPVDCQKEWVRRGYVESEYVMDIRVAPEGNESYHFADIDTDTMTDIGGDAVELEEDDSEMIMELIENYKHAPKLLAAKLTARYRRKNS